MEINKPVTIIILLIINLILIFLFVFPRYQETEKLQMSLYQKQQEYDSQSDYNIKVSEVLKNVESRGDILEKIDSALPGAFSLSDVVDFLQRKAAENKLAVQLISYSRVLPQLPQNTAGGSVSQLKSVTFMVDLSGSYRDFKNFLFSLEKSARLFEVNTMSFASKSPEKDKDFTQNQSENYDFKLELKTHTY